jgi:hypothetical protein
MSTGTIEEFLRQRAINQLGAYKQLVSTVHPAVSGLGLCLCRDVVSRALNGDVLKGVCEVLETVHSGPFDIDTVERMKIKLQDAEEGLKKLDQHVFGEIGKKRLERLREELDVQARRFLGFGRWRRSVTEAHEHLEKAAEAYGLWYSVIGATGRAIQEWKDFDTECAAGTVAVNRARQEGWFPELTPAQWVGVVIALGAAFMGGVASRCAVSRTP